MISAGRGLTAKTPPETVQSSPRVARRRPGRTSPRQSRCRRCAGRLRPARVLPCVPLRRTAQSGRRAPTLAPGDTRVHACVGDSRWPRRVDVAIPRLLRDTPLHATPWAALGTSVRRCSSGRASRRLSCRLTKPSQPQGLSSKTNPLHANVGGHGNLPSDGHKCPLVGVSHEICSPDLLFVPRAFEARGPPRVGASDARARAASGDAGESVSGEAGVLVRIVSPGINERQVSCRPGVWVCVGPERG